MAQTQPVTSSTLSVRMIQGKPRIYLVYSSKQRAAAATAKVFCRSHWLVLVCRGVCGRHVSLMLRGAEGLLLGAVCGVWRWCCGRVALLELPSVFPFPAARRRTVLERFKFQFSETRRKKTEIWILCETDIGSWYMSCKKTKGRPQMLSTRHSSSCFDRQPRTGFLSEE